MKAAGKIWVGYPGLLDVFTLYSVSDIHLGNIGCSKSMLLEDIARIKNDPYALWIGGGDYADFISPSDKRWAAGAMDPILRIKDLSQLGHVLTSQVRDYLMPIREKCLGMVFGNHESQYYNVMEQSNLHAWLCEELQVINLDYSSLFDVVFIRGSKHVPKPKVFRVRPDFFPRLETSKGGRGGETHTFRIYVHHGAGAAQTPGGKMNRLVQFMDSFDADLYFVNHIHDRVAKRIVTVGADADCGKLVERVKLGVVSGSYLKIYGPGTGYGEIKAYRPTAMGAAKVRLCPRTREYTGEV